MADRPPRDGVSRIHRRPRRLRDRRRRRRSRRAVLTWPPSKVDSRVPSPTAVGDAELASWSAAAPHWVHLPASAHLRAHLYPGTRLAVPDGYATPGTSAPGPPTATLARSGLPTSAPFLVRHCTRRPDHAAKRGDVDGDRLRPPESFGPPRRPGGHLPRDVLRFDGRERLSRLVTHVEPPGRWRAPGPRQRHHHRRLRTPCRRTSRRRRSGAGAPSLPSGWPWLAGPERPRPLDGILVLTARRADHRPAVGRNDLRRRRQRLVRSRMDRSLTRLA